jgi:hypothetical protein
VLAPFFRGGQVPETILILRNRETQWPKEFAPTMSNAQVKRLQHRRVCIIKGLLSWSAVALHPDKCKSVL